MSLLGYIRRRTMPLFQTHFGHGLIPTMGCIFEKQRRIVLKGPVIRLYSETYYSVILCFFLHRSMAASTASSGVRPVLTGKNFAGIPGPWLWYQCTIQPSSEVCKVSL